MRCGIFVRAVKNAYLGEKPPRDGSWQRRRVYEAINEVALMEVYGGYEALMAAPAWHVKRTTLVLMGRTQAEEKQLKDSEGGAGGAGGGGGVGRGNGSGRGDASSSAYADLSSSPPSGASSTYVARVYTSRYEPE